MVTKKVNMGNLILSFSDALDLANSKIAGHQQRTAYISLKFCELADLPEQTTINVFIAALLHDIGALSIKEKIALHEFEEKNTYNHCIRGELLLKRFDLFQDISEIVKYHHNKWDEFNPDVDKSVVMASQIVNLSDHIERLIKKNENILTQTDRIIDTINSYSRNLFNPQIVEYFKRISKNESFWLDIISPKIYSQLLNDGPLKDVSIDLVHLETISKLFRDIIDFKSSYTAAHSVGVSTCAEIIGRNVGLPDADIFNLKVASNLHDLGKLVIQNEILDKKEPLTEPEYQIMKSHPYYSYHIIRTIKGLENIADMAGFHHERLDGTGYPFHLRAKDLSIGSRIIIISDIFTALVEDRPYRAGMTKQYALKVLKDLNDRNKLDESIYDTAVKNYSMIYDYVMSLESSIKEFYIARIEKLALDVN